MVLAIAPLYPMSYNTAVYDVTHYITVLRGDIARLRRCTAIVTVTTNSGVIAV